jgi:hypothetical protein
MQRLLLTSSITVMLLSGVGFAAAQQTQGGGNAPSMNSPQSPSSSQSSNPTQKILMLSPAERQKIVQGLRDEQMQSLAQDEQAQVGSKPPESVSKQTLPTNVTSDVPQTKKLLFVKLPDRILLIDPDQQMVAEIIPVGDVNGQDSNGAGPNSDDQ